MLIIETPIFTHRIQQFLSDEEYRVLQQHLVAHPEAGKIIPGSRGLRKLRWGSAGYGKRGGLRIIYYWAVSLERLLMLLVYGKSEQDELTSVQLKQLKRIVEEEYP